ncbi:MAG TPA: ATP-binding protein [Vicinamibacteria bacterium]|nr:ATP-binding protein [Vicinamibacteria bacterium]
MSIKEFRLGFTECLALLTQRLAEPAPGRIQLLAGPRQVGKTTLLLELAERHGQTALYAAADGPEAAVPGFWERFWVRAEETAVREGRAILLLDEVHLLPEWAARLKGEWDRFRRRKRAVHVVATGSSALRLSTGSRESLAGRFERITLAHWSASSLSEVFGLEPAEATDHFVKMGSYPGAFELRQDIGRWSAYVRDAIVEPAIGRDVLALAAIRKPALLRQVFGVCASSPAEIVSLQKVQGQLRDKGAIETIAHYLQLLEDAFLVAALVKHSPRPARQRAAPPKLITLNNALLAVVDPRGIPDHSTESQRFGTWIENACLAHAWNRGQRVTYWREEPLEVDAVLEGSWGAWVVQVATGSVSSFDLRGLGEFTRRNPSFRPLVLCTSDGRSAVERAGFPAMSWSDFLLDGPPRAGGSNAS